MLINQRKETITDKHFVLKSLISKGIGLMFRPKVTDAYIFEFEKNKKLSFHTCFMFTTIDMLFLNDNRKVVAKRRAIKPFSVINGKAKYVIEMPEGISDKVQVGDVLTW